MGVGLRPAIREAGTAVAPASNGSQVPVVALIAVAGKPTGAGLVAMGLARAVEVALLGSRVPGGVGRATADSRIGVGPIRVGEACAVPVAGPGSSVPEVADIAVARVGADTCTVGVRLSSTIYPTYRR